MFRRQVRVGQGNGAGFGAEMGERVAQKYFE